MPSVGEIIVELRKYRPDQLEEALTGMSRAFGRDMTYESVRGALRRGGAPPMTTHMVGAPASARPHLAIPPPPPSDEIPVTWDDSSAAQNDARRFVTQATDRAPPPDAARFARLLEAAKRGPVPFADLCDRLDMAPGKARALVEEAQAAGLAIHTEHDAVSFRLPEPAEEIRDVGIAPTTGERHRVAVVSDLHFGSKYCLRQQYREFVHYAYESGVRHVLCPGDVLDGCYKHGRYELSHVGIEAQTGDFLDTHPRLPGMTFHGIGGNHDDTFSDAIGMDAGAYVQNLAEASGRTDVRFYGRRGARLRVLGAVVELWHPRSSGGYALSYQLQNHVRDYAVGQKPDILLAGHWHTWVYFETRGVHALACGTFQGNGSAFSKSLGGAPSMGGTLLSWELTQDRTLRRFQVERSAYYEHEQPREVA